MVIRGKKLLGPNNYVPKYLSGPVCSSKYAKGAQSQLLCADLALLER